ncbi:hypothetical protein AOA12_16445 [Microbacterium sp. No. 7]|nr:hypothetical protein AOA12_16445 [Microbacterium sp. No. 7]
MTSGATTAGGGFTYEWQSGWGADGHHDGSSTGWAHHGLVVTDDDRIITFAVDRPEVLVLNTAGELITSWTPDVVEGHGLFLTREGDEQFLWISDIGTKNRPQEDGSYEADAEPVHGAVVKYTLDGTELLRITAPGLDAYREGSFSPGQVAVDDQGSGDIWVCDPYGQALVLRFDRDGNLLTTLTGAEGAGEFKHPHAVFIDRRRGEPELLVADRINKRIQVFSLTGEYLRTFGEEFFIFPGGFAQRGDYLFVTELFGSVTILGPDNSRVGSLGQVAPPGAPGWPNTVNEAGAVVRPALEDGAFHTPHAAAFDSEGNLYLAEWLVGGRLDKLRVIEEPAGASSV